MHMTDLPKPPEDCNWQPIGDAVARVLAELAKKMAERR
jgi:hypothetical protein